MDSLWLCGAVVQTSWNARPGNDKLYGLTGDDAIHGDEGNDSLYGADLGEQAGMLRGGWSPPLFFRATWVVNGEQKYPKKKGAGT